VLGLVAETPDITVKETQAALAARGHAFDYGTLLRFFARRRITGKKRPRTPAGPPGYPETARGLVRGPARPLSGAVLFINET
jgi:hypothetical protein